MKQNEKKNNKELVRYLFWGVMAVGVNTALFMLLSYIISPIMANSVTFIICIFFTYFTNSIFVFRKPCQIRSFLQFFVVRIGGLLIDDLGLAVLLAMGLDKLSAKCIVNVIIIVMNYILSKMVVFRSAD